MSDVSKSGITVRLEPYVRDRIQRIATHEHRSVAAYVQRLIEQDLRTRDEVERVIHVFTAPELLDEPPGVLVRDANESDADYARRKDTMRALLGET